MAPQFWIYWAVTCPLTIVTILGWWATQQYLNRREVERRKQDESAISVIKRIATIGTVRSEKLLQSPPPPVHVQPASPPNAPVFRYSKRSTIIPNPYRA